jgi:hypothetical protein
LLISIFNGSRLLFISAVGEFFSNHHMDNLFYPHDQAS